MELRTKLFFILTIFFMIVLLIAFSTKASHWDQVSNKSLAETAFPQVYRSLEGLIVLDLLLLLLCFPIIYCFHNEKTGILKYLMIIMTGILVIRFIVSVVFLAGDDNYCRKTIQEDQNNKFTETLKTAWGFEIFAIMTSDILGGAILVFISREIKKSTDM